VKGRMTAKLKSLMPAKSGMTEARRRQDRA
jgi:hypothetical protein